MGVKLLYVLVELFILKVSRDYCRVVKNNDIIKLELVVKVINMEKFVVIYLKILLVGEIFFLGYIYSFMDFFFYIMVLVIQVD